MTNRNQKKGFYGDIYQRRSHQRRTRPSKASGGWTAASTVMVACIVLMVTLSIMNSALTGTRTQQARIPSGVTAPGPPFFVIGYAFDGVGNPIPGCHVNITDKRTGDWNNATVSDSNGYYRFDMGTLSGGYQVGDTINATVRVSSVTGWNQTTMTYASHLWLNVTVGGVVIPEFPGIALPIIGTLSLFVVAATVSRRGRDAGF